MATRILGIELGSYSVKVAVANAGLRGASVTTVVERKIPAGDASVEERGAGVVAEIIREGGFAHDTPWIAFPGDGVSLRSLDFPFSGLKRADLDKAVGAELESQLPHDLDELVYDFDILPKDLESHTSGILPVAEGPTTGTPGGAAVPPPAPTPRPPAGTRVLTAATTKERLGKFLQALSSRGVDARGLIAAPTVYARVADRLAALAAPERPGDAVLIIDHGHTRTNIAVVRRGKTLFARSLSRGGRHVTQAIAKAWNYPFEDAEQAKHSDGFIASQREPATSDAWQRISDVVRHELSPLVRDLRQTLAACRAQTGIEIARGVVCGGGSRLRGFVSFLAEELEVPIGLVTADDLPRLLSPAAAQRAAPGLALDVSLVAIAVALEGGAGRPTFDLRKGALAYKADYSFLRKKAGVLAACVLVVIAFAAVNAYASLYKLQKEEEVLDEKLRAKTTEVFGAPIALEELEDKLGPGKEASPLPRMTAYDQLNEISKRLPARTEVKIDVQEIDIENKKIFIKGTAESSAAIDAVTKKLEEIECFTEIQRGSMDAVSEGRQLTLTITSKCM